jgi:uncharacterized protein YcnI
MIRNRRAALRVILVAFGAAALGTVAFAAPALADITVTPTEAVQGGSTTMTFRVPNERPNAYTKKVEVTLPEATPIAEVYPLSVPDWAPQITWRDLPLGIPQVHGTLTNQIPSAITWIAVGSGAFKPGQPQDLKVDMGPLPTAGQVTFNLTQTYSDGTVVHWGGATPTGGKLAPVLKLIPGDGTSLHQHTGTELGTGTQSGTATDGTGGQAAGNTNTTSTGAASSSSGIGGNGLGLALAGAGLVAGVLIGVVVARGRRNSDLSVLAESGDSPDSTLPDDSAPTTGSGSPEGSDEDAAEPDTEDVWARPAEDVVLANAGAKTAGARRDKDVDGTAKSGAGAARRKKTSAASK